MAGRIYAAALLLILALGTASPNANAQSAAPPAEAAAIEDLALAGRILANEGVLDAYGHDLHRGERAAADGRDRLGGKVRYLSDIEGDNVTNKQPGNIARAWALWKERAKGK